MSLIVDSQDKVGAIEFKGDQLIVKGKPNLQEFQTLPENNNLQFRTMEREMSQGMRKQLNIENIIAKSTDQLVDQTEIDDHEIDDDWFAKFFNIVENISNEEMKYLWSKILSGEIITPGSYSLRTLDILRNLNKSEATIFEKYSKIAFRTSGGTFLLNNDKTKNYQEILKLMEAGLLNHGSTTNITLQSSPEGMAEYFLLGDNCLIVSSKEQVSVRFPVYVLTKAGEELLQIVSPTSNLPFLRTLKEYFANQSDKLTFIIGKIISFNEWALDYDPLEP